MMKIKDLKHMETDFIQKSPTQFAQGTAHGIVVFLYYAIYIILN